MKTFENIFFIIILIFTKKINTLDKTILLFNQSIDNNNKIARKLLTKKTNLDITKNPLKNKNIKNGNLTQNENLQNPQTPQIQSSLKTQILLTIDRTSQKLINCKKPKKKENENIICKYKDNSLALKIKTKKINEYTIIFYQHGNNDFYNINEIKNISDLKILEINSQEFFQEQMKYFKLHSKIIKNLFQKVDYLFCKKKFQKTICKYDDFNLAVVIRFYSISEKFFLVNFYQYGKQKKTNSVKIKSEQDLKKFSKHTQNFFLSQNIVFELHKKIIEIIYKKNLGIKCNGSVIRTICYYNDNTKAFLINNEAGSEYKIFIYKKGLEIIGSTLEISKIEEITKFEEDLENFLEKQKNYFFLYQNLVKKIIESKKYFICNGNSVKSECSYNGKDKAFLIFNKNGEHFEIEYFEYGKNEFLKNWEINNFESLRFFEDEMKKILDEQEKRLGNDFFVVRKMVL